MGGVGGEGGRRVGGDSGHREGAGGELVLNESAGGEGGGAAGVILVVDDDGGLVVRSPGVGFPAGPLQADRAGQHVENPGVPLIEVDVKDRRQDFLPFKIEAIGRRGGGGEQGVAVGVDRRYLPGKGFVQADVAGHDEAETDNGQGQTDDDRLLHLLLLLPRRFEGRG